MTRILVQRGSASSSSSSSNQSRSSAPPGPSSSSSPAVAKEEQEEGVLEAGSVDDHLQFCENLEDKTSRNDEIPCLDDKSKDGNGNGNANDVIEPGTVIKELGGLQIRERQNNSEENEVPKAATSSQSTTARSHPPPPPVPPPKPLAMNSRLRPTVSGGSSAAWIGPSRRAAAWPLVSARAERSDSRPSSPRSYGESDGYNSADEQNPCFGPARNDAERERQFELDIRRAKGFEVKRMLEDGNCLFRAVADQVYGDTEAYDLTRQMCIDYMERERDHFSQFITEGFVSYCKRKRRDKVYGNNVEIQALSEMYNRPIHIYLYSTEPINIFHGSYNTDVPPIRLSYHHGNHYNSLVDPRRLTIGAGLGFSSLQGANIDRDQVKAAIIAQQDQQINNALLAEGRFYSDLELTEKEMEQMVMDISRAEYNIDEKFKLQPGIRESSTSGAEPSSSGTTTGSSRSAPGAVISSNMQVLLSMGFTYLQVVEAYSIFGDDLDSMICYLLETGSSRRKGKQTE